MKKIIALVLAMAMCLGVCLSLTACDDKTNFVVGIAQLMEHESPDKATQGFIDALTEELSKEGKTVSFDTQVAGDANLCTTVFNTLTAKKVDLIMANATPALPAAANGTVNTKTASKVLYLTDKIVSENQLTTLMITHNMHDAIEYGNRLIMMHEGNIVVDVRGEEKKSLTIEQLLKLFETSSGSKFTSDKVFLSK